MSTTPFCYLCGLDLSDYKEKESYRRSGNLTTDSCFKYYPFIPPLGPVTIDRSITTTIIVNTCDLYKLHVALYSIITERYLKPNINLY